MTCTVSLVPRKLSGDWFIIPDPPTSRLIVPLPAARSETPGIRMPTDSGLRPEGRASSTSRSIVCCVAELSTSTSGASAVTVIDSCWPPSVS